MLFVKNMENEQSRITQFEQPMKKLHCFLTEKVIISLGRGLHWLFGHFCSYLVFFGHFCHFFLEGICRYF